MPGPRSVVTNSGKKKAFCSAAAPKATFSDTGKWIAPLGSEVTDVVREETGSFVMRSGSYEPGKQQ